MTGNRENAAAGGKKMEQNYSYWKIVGWWFLAVVAAQTVNNLTVQSPVLSAVLYMAFPLMLVLHPIYPYQMEWYWSPGRCRTVMRILGCMGIILAVGTAF